MAWSDEARAAALEARRRHSLAHREHRKSITRLYNLEQRASNFRFKGKLVPSGLKGQLREAKKANLAAYRRSASTFRKLQRAQRRTY
jgi:hypothetical protein